VSVTWNLTTPSRNSTVSGAMAGFPEISFIVSPHSSDLYHVLKDFQSGLAGVLGFTGVIITPVVNARLARKARLTTIQDERSALRAALLAELRMANGEWKVSTKCGDL
jgi:hypothetical protein